jgi:hypothetical protein
MKKGKKIVLVLIVTVLGVLLALAFRDYKSKTRRCRFDDEECPSI